MAPDMACSEGNLKHLIWVKEYGAGAVAIVVISQIFAGGGSFM